MRKRKPPLSILSYLVISIIAEQPVVRWGPGFPGGAPMSPQSSLVLSPRSASWVTLCTPSEVPEPQSQLNELSGYFR